LENVIFSIENYEIVLGQLLALIVLILLWIMILFKGYSTFFKLLGFRDINRHNRLKSLVSLSINMIFLILIVKLLGLNYILISAREYDLNVLNILIAILIVQVARSLDWIARDLIDTSEEEFSNQMRPLTRKESLGSRLVHIILIGLATLLLIENFKLDWGFRIPVGENSLQIHISNIIMAILAIVLARLLYWLVTTVFLRSFYNAREVDEGVRYAFNQLIGYIIFFIAVLFALQNLGVNMNLIWGGAAALMVGIGLGLQQTFADFFAGIVLLFERSVKIGDVLELNDTKGIVSKIGLRTSVILTPRGQSLVIPNSQLTNQQVINWTHIGSNLRFEVSVDVAYGTNTDLVKGLLLEVANSTKGVLKSPKPFVRFNNFGDNALQFAVYFFSTRYLDIEDVKSEVRLEINRVFESNAISIPFPQRDIWIKKE